MQQVVLIFANVENFVILPDVKYTRHRGAIRASQKVSTFHSSESFVILPDVVRQKENMKTSSRQTRESRWRYFVLLRENDFFNAFMISTACFNFYVPSGAKVIVTFALKGI